MSQVGILVPGGTPSIATSYVTDFDSTAVPIANVLIVAGGSTTANNNSGIETVGSNGIGNTLSVVLTNRSVATVSTNDATPTICQSFILENTPTVYIFEGSATGINTTDSLGVSYSFTIGVRTDGVSSTIIGSSITNQLEEASMVDCSITFSATLNKIQFFVTGLAGKTINWICKFSYIEVQ